MTTSKTTRKKSASRPVVDGRSSPLMVRSVEKAFNILNAFRPGQSTLGLTQIAESVGIDKSTAQRFAHTLETLGYIYKDPDSKRFSLTVKTLAIGNSFLQSNLLVQQAAPYLSHLSQVTEETVNLSVLDGTEVVYLSRFISRHIFKTDVVVGSRLPAYCTAAGISILSRMPIEEAMDVLKASDLRPITASTTTDLQDLRTKIQHAAKDGFTTTFEEYFHDDLSVGAAIVDSHGKPAGAITVSVSRARYTPEEVVERFARLVIAAANAVKV